MYDFYLPRVILRGLPVNVVAGALASHIFAVQHNSLLVSWQDVSARAGVKCWHVRALSQCVWWWLILSCVITLVHIRCAAWGEYPEPTPPSSKITLASLTGLPYLHFFFIKTQTPLSPHHWTWDRISGTMLLYNLIVVSASWPVLYCNCICHWAVLSLLLLLLCLHGRKDSSPIETDLSAQPEKEKTVSI